METFELNKGQTIRSVLEWPFRKVTLDYLVVNEDLILESGLVKFHVDKIMESWTRKHVVVDDVLDEWLHQFQPLEYVFDDAFSNVIHPIEMEEFFGVVLNLPDNKAAGLSGITNKLWKHCDRSVKRQEAVYGYRLNSHYVVKTGRIDLQDSLTSFLAVDTFEQVQAKDKVAAVICFANSVEILGQLFMHRSHNLQVLSWCPVHFLSFLVPVYLWVILCVMLFASDMEFLYLVSLYLHDFGSFNASSFPLDVAAAKNILESHKFSLRSVDIKASTAVFFKNINLGFGVKVTGMVFSTLAELQAIALALECVLSLSSVCLFFDSQAVLNTCKAELLLHSDVSGNDQANLLASVFSHSGRLFFFQLKKCFVLANGSIVSKNSRHFVCSGTKIVNSCLLTDIDWFKSSLVWHSDSHMAVGFMSHHFAGFHSYFMKALYHRLSVAVHKHLYDKCYPSVVCLYCGNVEMLDHVFSSISGLSHVSSCVLQMLSNCLGDLGLVALLCKGFVLVDWYQETASCFDDSKTTSDKVVEFVCGLCLSFKNDIWLVCSKHHAFMKKHDLISHNGLIFVSVSGGMLMLLVQMIRLLGIDNAFGVSFELYSSYWFFSGIGNLVSVYSQREQDIVEEKVFLTSYSLHTSTISLDVSLFVNIELASPVTGGFGSTSAGLGNWLDAKKKESKTNSVDGLSDLENIKNTVTEKTSYANSDNSVIDGMEDDTTPRKIHTCMYVLGQSLKAPLFDVLSDNENMVALLPPKFKSFNQLLSTRSRVSDKRKFEPVKSFVLDIEFSAVPSKLVGNKLVSIKKIFYQVDGFGGASTPSKFPEIIKSSFTSELSLNKTKELAIHLSRSAVVSVFSKFGKVVSVKIQLIGLWQKALVEFDLSEVANLVASKWSVLMRKNSVQVALAVKDKQSWVFRDQHRTLLYTLPVGITAHNLSGLIESYSSKTCFIGHNLSSYVHNRCVVICFADESSKLAVIGSNRVCLAGIYKKKQALIACSVFFGNRTWAQVAGGFSSQVASLIFFGAGLFLVAETSLFASASSGDCDMYGHLVSLECSLELLADQVSGILKKLGSIKLVPLVTTFDAFPSAVLVSVVSGLDLDMVLNSASAISNLSPPVISGTAPIISPSSSKVLTTKVGGLKSKIVALEISVESVLEKLDYLCSGLGSSAAFISQ
ncbi:hypothetical protein G9A89_020308 [Geosiphon pyriformis]|nr:hypothetical protein G9A89_020308 [Geosiphon pyriformis]